MNKLEKLSHLFRIMDSVANIEVSVRALSLAVAKDAKTNPLKPGLTDMLEFLASVHEVCDIPSMQDKTLNALMTVMTCDSDRQFQIESILEAAKEKVG